MCGLLESLAAEAVALGEHRPRAVLGIAGSPGAGKSTLVELLLERIERLRGPGWAAHVPMDGFHLADDQLRRLGRLDRKGAPDTFDAAGYAHLLKRVRDETGADVYAPGFDRGLEQPLAAALVVPTTARLVVTEGNYLLLERPEWLRARQMMDRVWFVAADEHIRTARLVFRHVEFGKSAAAARAWVGAVDRRNAELVAGTAAAADRVIVNGAQGWVISG
ncbi:nucleoside/nucleotide kinase family protein [Mycobacterium sp. NAZ190054]|uniref:nucleoside/nucleotide kinase family protein n=1 Tax=Mycobacterium sp. NAZ190054 TaxID=1747766 RepID=UPI000ABB32F1|nr:nucleoside/nucleotide kinase family protein [Mycobacterium sp. NAZ190054]